MPQHSYSTVLAPASAEFTEKRSRFLCEIRPLQTEAEAAAFIAGQKNRYHDASHNCSAYILRTGSILRYSDDGEPQGTAGVPMLEVLRREGLTDVAAVVTRYFGGILLGGGGLVRAYSHSVKLAVDAAVRVRMCLCTRFMLELPYAAYGKVNTLLQSLGVEILDSAFAADVTISARLASEDMSRLEQELTELSGGGIVPVTMEEEFAPVRE